MLVISVITLN